jgi:hypothetical protein
VAYLSLTGDSLDPPQGVHGGDARRLIEVNEAANRGRAAVLMSRHTLSTAGREGQRAYVAVMLSLGIAAWLLVPDAVHYSHEAL